jgi:hypothetical protein
MADAQKWQGKEVLNSPKIRQINKASDSNYPFNLEDLIVCRDEVCCNIDSEGGRERRRD